MRTPKQTAGVQLNRRIELRTRTISLNTPPIMSADRGRDNNINMMKDQQTPASVFNTLGQQKLNSFFPTAFATVGKDKMDQTTLVCDSNNVIERVDLQLEKMKASLENASSAEGYKRDEMRLPDSEAKRLKMNPITEPARTNPQTVDLLAVKTMFDTIQNEMKMQFQKINNQRTEEKMGILTSANLSNQETIKQLEDEVKMLTVKTQILTGSLDKTNQVVTEMQKKITNLEISKAKRTFILSGFEADTRKKYGIQQLYDFFSAEMGVEVIIEDMYYTGLYIPKSMVITLQTLEQKKAIFKSIDRIKDYRNSAGKRYGFKDYYTAQALEKRKREFFILNTNEDKHPLQQDEIEIENGQLTINGNNYTKIVRVPDPTKILLMPREDLQEVLDIKVYSTEPQISGRQHFPGIFYICKRSRTSTEGLHEH